MLAPAPPRQLRSSLLTALSAGLAIACAGCADTLATPMWQPSGLSSDFFAMPFPSDARVDADGHPDLTGFPGSDKMLVSRYTEAISNEVVGFGRNSAIYFRFDRALASSDLPSPEQSLRADAAVQLIDVDPDSPNYGQRVPVVAAFRREASRYIGANYLAVTPYPGFPLEEATTYAAIVTTAIANPAAAFSPHLAATAPADDGSGRTAPLYASFAPLRNYLAAEPSAPTASDIAVATVFTTRASNTTMRALADYVESHAAPQIDELAFAVGNDQFRLYEGSYTAPNFQQGALPYNTAGTGHIDLDGEGQPVVARQESMRVAITIPTTAMPASGWPVIMYAHGTGGDFKSFVSERLALRYAKLGFAMISIDQVLHGPRSPNSDPEISFFNYFNPYAARDNVLQGSVDLLSLRRLVDTIAFTEEDAEPTRPCHFDGGRVYFIGHSQGALTGTPYLAYAKDLAGAVLSGGGALFYISATKKVEPLDIPTLIAGALGETTIEDFHPVLALAQLWIDPSDPVNYGPLISANTPTRAPFPVFLLEGMGDSYTPNPGAEALVTSMGIPQLAPPTQAIAGLTLRSLVPAITPLRDNIHGVTMALGQYQPNLGDDGHFVLFDQDDAIRQTSGFLASLMTTGHATIPQ